MSALTEEHHAYVLGFRDLGDNDKLECIYTLKRECAWNGPRTARAVADLWRCTPAKVNSLLRQAELVFQHEIAGKRETLAAELISKVEWVSQSAMNAKKPFLNPQTGEILYGDAPDHKAALAGLNMIMDAIGMKGAKARTNPVGSYQDLTLQQMVEQMKELVSKETAVVTAGEDNGDEEESGQQRAALPEQRRPPDPSEDSRLPDPPEEGSGWGEW